MDLTASLCHKTFFLQSVPLSNTVSPSLVNHFFPPSRKKTDETFICEQRKKGWSSEDEGSRPNQQVSVLICYTTLLFFFFWNVSCHPFSRQTTQSAAPPGEFGFMFPAVPLPATRVSPYPHTRGTVWELRGSEALISLGLRNPTEET